MPDYPHIERYREELAELIEFGGSDSELNIRPAFQNCLAAYCRDHRERLLLVPELAKIDEFRWPRQPQVVHFGQDVGDGSVFG